MKSLKKILATGALIVGGLASSFVNVGCSTDPAERQKEIFAWSLLGGLTAVQPNATPNERGLGRLAYDAAQNQADRDAYRNQGDVNVNVDVQGQQSPQINYAQRFLDKLAREKIVVFKWDDVNKDGIINLDNPNETIFTDIFYEGDQVTYILGVPPMSRINIFLKTEEGGKFLQRNLLNNSKTKTENFPQTTRFVGGSGITSMVFEAHIDSEDGPLYAKKEAFYGASTK